jgi:polyferredoxin
VAALFQTRESSGRQSCFNYTTRFWIQLFVLGLTLAIGIQFAVYIHQLTSNGPVSASRPPGIEGFLPIGALAGWKLLFLEGIWNPVHPAAMVIAGFATLISIGFKKSFCSWFCPVGAVSEWLWKMGRKIFGKNFRLPSCVDIPMRCLKYHLLGFFLYAVLSMDGDSLLLFLNRQDWDWTDITLYA